MKLNLLYSDPHSFTKLLTTQQNKFTLPTLSKIEELQSFVDKYLKLQIQHSIWPIEITSPVEEKLTLKRYPIGQRRFKKND